MLERVGAWLLYVAANVDRVVYYDAPLVPTDDGRRLVGLG